MSIARVIPQVIVRTKLSSVDLPRYSFTHIVTSREPLVSPIKVPTLEQFRSTLLMWKQMRSKFLCENYVTFSAKNDWFKFWCENKLKNTFGAKMLRTKILELVNEFG
jgi:hypothetical protein